MKLLLDGDYFAVLLVSFSWSWPFPYSSSILKDGGKPCSVNEPQEIDIAVRRLCTLVLVYYKKPTQPATLKNTTLNLDHRMSYLKQCLVLEVTSLGAKPFDCRPTGNCVLVCLRVLIYLFFVTCCTEYTKQ